MAQQKQTPDQIIDAAKAAFDAAALAQWDRDGREDCGSCGGFILSLHGASPVSKQLLARKLGYRGSPGVTVMFRLPDGIRSQNVEITDKAHRAAKAVFEAAGVKIVEARSYTD